MFKKIAAVQPFTPEELVVWFADGETRLFNLRVFVQNNPEYAGRADSLSVDTASLVAEGYGISWGDDLDLGCKEVYSASTPIDLVDNECKRVISDVVQSRHEKGLSQARLAMAAGVKQPVVARLETGVNSPRLDTLLKILTPLGKTLVICDLTERNE